MLGLCHGLQRAGIEVEVVTTTANGSDSLPLPPGGEHTKVRAHYAARCFRSGFSAPGSARCSPALQRADVCHIHGVERAGVVGVAPGARRRPGHLAARHAGSQQAMARGPWRKAAAFALLDRRNLTRAALLHATSEQEAGAIRALGFGVPIAVVPNGVDLDGPRGASDGGSRARLGIPADAFVVLFLGRMHRIKRLDLLADAFAAAHATHPSVHLVLAGPDEHGLVPGLRQRLTGVVAFVHAIGDVHGADKWTLLKDADVMVQCSDSESFGLAVVEALASGVPVVATRTCPWSEIETQQCGFWVDQTAPAIAAAIRTLADDPRRRARMGERAVAFARDRYSWDAIAPQMARLYADLS